jgi:hypothetical protein
MLPIKGHISFGPAIRIVNNESSGEERMVFEREPVKERDYWRKSSFHLGCWRRRSWFSLFVFWKWNLALPSGAKVHHGFGVKKAELLVVQDGFHRGLRQTHEYRMVGDGCNRYRAAALTAYFLNRLSETLKCGLPPGRVTQEPEFRFKPNGIDFVFEHLSPVFEYTRFFESIASVPPPDVAETCEDLLEST